MSGYVGPTSGELPDGWRWWRASFERHIYASSSNDTPDNTLVWIERDGTEHHLDEAPPAVGRALRQKWCDVWGWDVRSITYSDDSRAVLVGARSGMRDQLRRWSYKTVNNARETRYAWPAPVRALVADMLEEGGAR